MIPPDHRPDPGSVLTLCPTCGELVMAGHRVHGVCPPCVGVRACRHCGGRTEELDATGHCEGCCEGVFIPRSAHIDLDALADARWSALGTEVEPEVQEEEPCPWESWPGDRAGAEVAA